MKFTYTSLDGRLVAEFEASEAKAAVKIVGDLQEIFEEGKCGKCASERIRCSTNTDKDGNTYYKLRCLDCAAQLDFGQHREGGTLFAKRRHPDSKEALPHHGWYIWGDDPHERPEEQPKVGYAAKPADKPPKHQDVRPVKTEPVGEPMTVGDAAAKALHVKTLKEADAIMQRCASLAGLQKAWSENWAGGSWAPKTKLALVDLVAKHKTRLGWKPAEVPA